MAIMNGESDDMLLRAPTETEYTTLTRTASSYNPTQKFVLPKGENRHYQQQYADMYFARLAQLKPAVEAVAAESFDSFTLAGQTAHKVDRALDVRQGELCWVVGTCYMEMPLKPNVLDDLGKEHWIAAPPPRVKYAGTTGAQAEYMLEDESGRIRLTGSYLQNCLLVTGAIIAVVGTENANGDFEVLDLRIPDLPRQPARWERDDAQTAVQGKSLAKERPTAGKIAIVSGLGINAESGASLTLDMLVEYLLGEATSPQDQEAISSISRLIIAGNSLSHASPIPTREEVAAAKKANAGTTHKKYGYDSAAYNSTPTEALDTLLATLLPSLPVTLLPGDSDPTSTSLPQQPIHAAMFPQSRGYMSPPGADAEPGWFDSQTNPAEFDVDGFRFVGTGGQTVNDIYKYVDSEDRMEMMEAMLRWRLTAPTAPDTLWCYPFQDGDAFVMQECPHVYFAGNQPTFETCVVEGPAGQQVRIIAVPKFSETGEMVLLDVETLVPEVVRFEIFENE